MHDEIFWLDVILLLGREAVRAPTGTEEDTNDQCEAAAGIVAGFSLVFSLFFAVCG
jgi:hypothetical protein